jgi:hypothetical protein
MMLNVMTVPTIADLLRDASDSFELVTRDDASTYYRIAEGKTDHERAFRLWLADEVVQPLHGGELPNDWRYETIRDLCVDLLDSSQADWMPDEYREIVPEIADSMVHLFTGPLFSWLAEHSDRYAFDDECSAEGKTDLVSMAQARQYEEIASMAYGLINALSTRQALISLENHG